MRQPGRGHPTGVERAERRPTGQSVDPRLAGAATGATCEKNAMTHAMFVAHATFLCGRQHHVSMSASGEAALCMIIRPPC